MDSCDVVIVGGGPGGSSCAWRLARAGFDVVIVDAARFPRDKVCAGWITPQVVDDLGLDLDAFGRSHTVQPITAFRTGLIGQGSDLETTYGSPVSFGIRRCEFDTFLLHRSGARLRVGTGATEIRRDGGNWVVNDTVRAPMLVGAGGHFCPVARAIGNRSQVGPLVVARETEFAIDARSARECPVTGTMPELYFSGDLQGYGWCFRKGSFLNLGFGTLNRHALPKATADFVEFLVRKGRLPAGLSFHWRGHAYLLADANRRVVDDGVLLVGDAAGLAYPQSGEGIRPAIESGLLAASTIAQAQGRYDRDQLASYERRLRARLSTPRRSWLGHSPIPAGVSTALAPTLFDNRWFVRHVLLNRWFLHAHERALAA